MVHCQRSVLDDNNPFGEMAHYAHSTSLLLLLSLPTMVGWPICSGRKGEDGLLSSCERAYHTVYQTRHSSAAMMLIPGDTGRR